MAFQKPSHRSSMPRPLETPRVKPFSTTSRKCGDTMSKGFSVHLAVHGKIKSNTPSVAQTVTNSRARIRRSHRLASTALSELPESRSGFEKHCPFAVSWFWPVAGEMVLGSAFTPGSRNPGLESIRLRGDPYGYFTA